MKLNVTSKGKQSAVLKKEEHQRTGKRSRNKGSTFERDTAKKFKGFYNVDLVRTPQSGGFAKNCKKADEFRGDIVSADDTIDLILHIECKNAKSWSLPSWIKQSQEDCPKGKIPTVIFHQHGTSKDFIALSLEDFFNLVPKENVIFEKKVTKR